MSLEATKKRILLHSLLKEGVLLPGAFNALTALQAQRAGAKGLYISGAALSACVGKTDTGLLSLEDFVTLSKPIVDAVGLPIICDADTGFGDVASCVKAYEGIGLCGLHLEDQVFPKRCGHLEGKAIVSTQEMCERIQEAVTAKQDSNFLVIARSDSLAQEGIEGLLDRAKAYKAAGADLVFCEALTSKAMFQDVGDTLYKKEGISLMANMTEFGKSPLISAKDLFGMGYKLVIFPVSALRVAMKATEYFYKESLKVGSQKGFLDDMQSRSELYDLLDYKP